MLLYFAKLLVPSCRFFTIFSYITLRCILAALSAFLVSLLVGEPVIRSLTRRQIGELVRSDGPASHFCKAGTPTMGGLLILIAIITSTLLWVDLNSRHIWLILSSTILFGAIGLLDDYLKLFCQRTRGLTARYKLLLQLLATLPIIFYLFLTARYTSETTLIIPFFKQVCLELGWLYVPWGLLVILGTSNAVNLTDGLDGLAILPIVMIAGALGIFAYVGGHLNFAKYLLMPYIPALGEIAIFCSAILGAGLGFLWFNTYPAQIFMGDVGSLGLGAALGTIAVIIRQELTFMVMGGVFVLEALSVIFQVTSYRWRGKRIFKMAPLHHHFELLGWPEPKIIVRFWIITCILVLLGLSSLKIR